jgi:hypothetical protein
MSIRGSSQDLIAARALTGAGDPIARGATRVDHGERETAILKLPPREQYRDELHPPKTPLGKAALVSAGIAAMGLGFGQQRAQAGYTDPAIPDSVYVERAKQYLGPISWHQQPDGSMKQRGGCVYVKVFFTDPSTGLRRRTVASGVLINEWTVVTAGHLVNKVNPTISVGWGLNCLINSPDEIPVAQLHIHPGYLKNGPANDPDMAVLVLQKPAIDKETGKRSAAAFLGAQPVAYKATLELCGYGLTNNNVDTGEPRAGNSLFDPNPISGSSTLYKCADPFFAPAPRLSGWKGDSGGLVRGEETIVEVDGTTRRRSVIMGHMVAASLFGGLGFTDWLDYREQRTRAFIVERMKTELPELSIEQSGGSVVVSWPEESPYHVQLVTSRDLTTWTPQRTKPVAYPSPSHNYAPYNHVTFKMVPGDSAFFRLENKID